MTWGRDLGDAVRPLAMTAGYVNYLDADEADRIPDAYGSGYARLLELKRRHERRRSLPRLRKPSLATRGSRPGLTGESLAA